MHRQVGGMWLGKLQPGRQANGGRQQRWYDSSGSSAGRYQTHACMVLCYTTPAGQPQSCTTPRQQHAARAPGPHLAYVVHGHRLPACAVVGDGDHDQRHLGSTLLLQESLQ